jgi:hypothetical protein
LGSKINTKNMEKETNTKAPYGIDELLKDMSDIADAIGTISKIRDKLNGHEVCPNSTENYDKRELVSFGKYLLSEERELRLRQTSINNSNVQPYCDRFRDVYDADIRNWEDAETNAKQE